MHDIILYEILQTLFSINCLYYPVGICRLESQAKKGKICKNKIVRYAKKKLINMHKKYLKLTQNKSYVVILICTENIVKYGKKNMAEN